MFLSLRLQKLHTDSRVVAHWMVFLKTRPFVKRNNEEFTEVSSFTSLLMCSAHFTLSWGNFFFPSPRATIFSSFWILESLESLPGGSCLGPHGVVFLSGNGMSSELDSLWFWTSDIQALPTSCKKLLYFTFLFVSSVLYLKNALKSAHLTDTIPLFSTILQFSSELSNNWGTGLPRVHPSWL